MKTVAITIDEQVYDIQVPEDLVRDAADFFSKMDSDMDQGWQLSKNWVDNPSRTQRFQIVADKIYQAINAGNEKLTIMMTAYILHHAPDTSNIQVDTSGDMSLTEIS